MHHPLEYEAEQRQQRPYDAQHVDQHYWQVEHEQASEAPLRAEEERVPAEGEDLGPEEEQARSHHQSTWFYGG